MKYLATFTPLDLLEMPGEKYRQFDVTPEITALGGAIPRADSNGTDLMQYATNAPNWIKTYQGEFVIEVRAVDEPAAVE